MIRQEFKKKNIWCPSPNRKQKQKITFKKITKKNNINPYFDFISIYYYYYYYYFFFFLENQY
jgi:hypothetical protein